jgi:membrane-associated phospholipid phosphatase
MDNRIPIPRVESGTTGLESTRRFWPGPRQLVLAAVLAVQPLAVTAQTVTLPAPADQPSAIKWWEGALVIGGISGLMLLDGPTQRFAQDHRSRSGNHLASGFRHAGQPEVYGTITLGLLGTGLITGNDGLARAGGRLAATLALAGAASTMGKWVFGRPRPDESLDADGYVPFSGQQAMPSGHTTMAFALATALADDIHRPWASVGLYTVATGVGWSRVNDNRHWLTDVAAGAVLGITSAKLVSGRWRIFNLRTPQFLLGPGQATVAWNLTF